MALVCTVMIRANPSFRQLTPCILLVFTRASNFLAFALGPVKLSSVECLHGVSEISRPRDTRLGGAVNAR